MHVHRHFKDQFSEYFEIGGGAGGGRRQDPHLFDSTVQIQICDNNLIECMKTETEEAQKEDLPSVIYMNIYLSHQQSHAY